MSVVMELWSSAWLRWSSPSPAPKVTPANVSGGGGSRSELVITWEVSKPLQCNSPSAAEATRHYSQRIWALVSLITADWVNVWHFIFKNREAITAAVTLGKEKCLWGFNKIIKQNGSSKVTRNFSKMVFSLIFFSSVKPISSEYFLCVLEIIDCCESFAEYMLVF